MTVTPEDLRALAAKHEAAGMAAIDKGDGELAAAEFARAKAARVAVARLEQLTAGNNPGIDKGMTSAQREAKQRARRGRRAAEGKAAVSGHPVALAIVASRWRNQTRYALERLKISQPALSRYINGSLETPAEVADAVKADFGLDDRVWPRPPRR